MSWIICELCCTSPASAGFCFFSSKSRLGACQFGSVKVVSADCSSAALSRATLPFRLESFPFLSSSNCRVGTPSLSLICPADLDGASFVTSPLVLRIKPASFLFSSDSSRSNSDFNRSNNVFGLIRSTNKTVMSVNIASTNAAIGTLSMDKNAWASSHPK